MAGKVTEWPSNRGLISKIWPSDSCKGDTVPLAVERWYDFPEFGGYLGNVGLVYQFLRKVYSDVSERRLCAQNAIVLIDEIDAHLHPAWQRKIVFVLRQRFPNIQFVLTAHSPLVVAGCSYGEVSVLKWVGESLQVVEFQQNFVGTSVDDIYRDIFDVGERDEAFLEYYAQLPIVQDLEKELTALRSKSNVDQQRIDRVEEELSLIKGTYEKEEKDLHLEALQRENEQLKRQLTAARRSERQALS
jgi:hypothetical protein